jgi:hypothetical protein
MRLMQRISILVSLAVVPSAFIGSLPAPAQSAPTSTLFSCGKNRDGYFTTYARPAKGGKVPVITWRTTVGDRFDPATRCQIVSERFQSFHNRGTLRFLTTGRMNNQNVVCVASAPGKGCMSDGLLFTVTQSANATSVLRQLSTINSGASGSPLSESSTTKMQTETPGCQSNQEIDNQLYVNLDCRLNDPAAIEYPSEIENILTPRP